MHVQASVRSLNLFLKGDSYPLMEHIWVSEYLNVDSRQWELSSRLEVAWHMTEELPAILVPLDGVQNVGGAQRPAARQLRSSSQRHMGRHAQLQQLQARDSVFCEQRKKQKSLLKENKIILHDVFKPFFKTILLIVFLTYKFCDRVVQRCLNYVEKSRAHHECEYLLSVPQSPLQGHISLQRRRSQRASSEQGSWKYKPSLCRYFGNMWQTHLTGRTRLPRRVTNCADP